MLLFRLKIRCLFIIVLLCKIIDTIFYEHAKQLYLYLVCWTLKMDISKNMVIK